MIKNIFSFDSKEFFVFDLAAWITYGENLLLMAKISTVVTKKRVLFNLNLEWLRRELVINMFFGLKNLNPSPLCQNDSHVFEEKNGVFTLK